MDKKLKQLENQSLPDLSKMDEHWEKMKKDLVPGPSFPKNNTGSKRLIWIVAVAVVGFLFFTVYRSLFQDPGQQIVQSNKSENKTDTLPSANIHRKISGISTDSMAFRQQRQQLSTDTVAGKAVTTEGKKVHLLATHVKSRSKKDAVYFKNKPNRRNASQPIKLNGKTTEGKNIEIIATPVGDTTTKKEVIDKKKLLNNFFARLEQQEQSFVINNQKDTVIRGNEGTALLIPAFTLGGSSGVTISMKEYYSYQDIITNKLTTCSDGRLLVTGGMLHITASVNGKEVDIQPGKSIRWFVPDTSAEIKKMQLFNGVVNNGSLKRLSENSDTAIIDFSGNINWMPKQNFFSGDYLYTSVRVLDLRDEPFKSRETKRGKIGKFNISPDSRISKEQLEDYMLNKRGYYKVKVKAYSKSRSFFKRLVPRFVRTSWDSYESLGDSAWIDMGAAARNNLKATDTIVSTRPGAGRFEFNFNVYVNGRPDRKFDTVFSKTNLNNLANRFSVDIRTLGWINCDRFYNDYRPKIDYIVDLGDEASDYYTLLVFDKMKSMMTGSFSGNKVAFRNVPEGETARFIAISVKDGKPVAAMQPVQLSRTILEGIKFEETTAPQFKEKAGSLDQP